MLRDADDMDGQFSMSKRHRSILSKNRVLLAENLQLREVVDQLVSAGLINQHLEELIFASVVPRERTRTFLINLPKLGPTAFDKFIQALRVTQQHHIIDHLMPEGESGATASGEIFSYFGGPASIIPVTSEEEGGRSLGGDLKNCDKIGSVTDYQTGTVKLSSYGLHSSKNVHVLIINNENFEMTDLESRDGSAVDLQNLQSLFSDILKFNVDSYEDLSGNEMKLQVKSFSERECLTEADACIIVIMTHGLEGVVVGNDRKIVPITEIMSLFGADKCKNLADKPKYFIFQCCRGEVKEKGFDATDSPVVDKSQAYQGIPSSIDPAKNPSAAIPALADTLVSYSTTYGHVSWRNSHKGSWFIQSLCRIFSEYANSVDVVSMLTMVTDDVIKNYGQEYKQLCEYVSHLRKQFYLTPRN